MQRGQTNWSALDLNRPARIIADELGCAVQTVRYHQRRAGIECRERAARQNLPDLSGGRMLLLGAIPDADVAAVWHCRVQTVAEARRHHGIPVWEPDPDNPPPQIRVRGHKQHFRPCVHCSTWFPTPPSSGNVTCSMRCLSAHRRLCLRLRKQGWSEAARQKLRGKGRPEQLKNGTVEARRLALEKPADFHEAKLWHVITPDGKTRVIVNLRRTLINELGEAEGIRIARVLTTMSRAMRNGREAWVTRCGWSLLQSSTPKRS
jgi:hypothetical protein